ncbi:30S ribosomal protein S8 [Candidatus Roizmanbacteria bacterium CG10_big_fil_rev_8_21_14_0_10_39_6]|uniref:Small ribosomal subunit protein uS8 n=1 Tax=Candidatus Roizmanbacteria bacterium CG10_big_fil_rev_8_21_14_0_10_39_6 TaxID=1974853 RepID=A0A2M8KSW0_9BACT|nr:MAG: 30S ribosomal protein S8 [Candidatus Roizmanbacteria bacterium CG10_big_fil_rev_8_21_14_0_10_39_6]
MVKSVMITDPVGDMLIRIKNAYLAGKENLDLPSSNAKERIAKVLEKRDIVKAYSIKDRVMTVTLNMERDRILQIKRLSTSGRRIYMGYSQLYSVKGGRGFLLVNTSQGMMTEVEAKKKKIGGEVLAEIF